jgi:putative flippase GtrA
MAFGRTGMIATIGRSRGVRFLTVGVLSVAVDTGSLYVLHGVLKVWLPVATALAYLVAFVVNFGLNRLWVFADNGQLFGQLWRYLLLVAVNLGATVLLVSGLAATGLPYLVAKLCTAAGLAVVNFFVSRRWIFPAGTRAGDRAEAGTLVV